MRRGLIVALVAVVVGSVLIAISGCGESVAAAPPSHQPSPTGSAGPHALPRVTGVSPSRTAAGTWGQGSATVLYRPGDSPLALGRCQLTIDGQRISSQATDAHYATGRMIQFSWTSYRPPTGKLTFRVVLVTQAGQSVAHHWTYDNPGGSQP